MPEDQIDHPDTFIKTWLEAYGLPTNDYEVASGAGKTFLTWYDLPRRRRIMSISLFYEKQGDCMVRKESSLDCKKYKWAFSKIRSQVILKDRELIRLANRSLEKLLKQRQVQQEK